MGQEGGVLLDIHLGERSQIREHVDVEDATEPVVWRRTARVRSVADPRPRSRAIEPAD